MDVSALILGALAVARLAYLVSRERGPFSLAERLRAAALRRWPREWLELGHSRDHWVVEGLHCPYCVSFWLALPVGLLLTPDPWAWPLWWLGIAGAALVLLAVVDRQGDGL